MNPAHFLQDFQHLFLLSLEALALPPSMLAGALCIVSVVLAFVRQHPFRTGLWRPSDWLIFTQLLFFPAMVAVGALFPSAPGWPFPIENVTGKWLLKGFVYLSVATSAFWFYRMKGLRWLSASLLVLQELVLVGAGFIAGMSVRGDWP
jgi:hypothetical protein